MILAQIPDYVGPLVGWGIIIALAVGTLFLVRGYQSWAESSLKAAYEGLALHEVPQPGDVVLEYHTYHGFIAWFTQTPHRAVLSPEDARTLLGRLLRFNLTWGLFTAGMVFGVPLSIFNYYAQLRSIQHQEANPTSDGAEAAIASAPATANLPEPSGGSNASPLRFQSRSITPPQAQPAPSGSWFHLIVGGLMALMALLLSCSTVYGLILGQQEMWIASGILALILGFFAKSWIDTGRGVA